MEYRAWEVIRALPEYKDIYFGARIPRKGGYNQLVYGPGSHYCYNKGGNHTLARIYFYVSMDGRVEQRCWSLSALVRSAGERCANYFRFISTLSYIHPLDYAGHGTRTDHKTPSIVSADRPACVPFTSSIGSVSADSVLGMVVSHASTLRPNNNLGAHEPAPHTLSPSSTTLGRFVHKWKGAEPHGIAIGSDNIIYVANARDHCIDAVQSDGAFIRKFGHRGPGNGGFVSPAGVAIGIGNGVNTSVMAEMYKIPILGAFPPGLLPICAAYAGDDYIVTTDTGKHCVQVFRTDGAFVRKWGSKGDDNGQFKSPYDCDVGVNGMVYICDTYNDRVQVFDWNGKFIRKWSVGEETQVNGVLRSFQFSPRSISVNTDGLVFIIGAEDDTTRILCYSTDAAFVRCLTPTYDTAIAREASFVTTVVVDNEEAMVYVSDSGTRRIYQFRTDGRFVRQWRGDNENLSTTSAMAKGKNGLLYIVEWDSKRILAMNVT